MAKKKQRAGKAPAPVAPAAPEKPDGGPAKTINRSGWIALGFLATFIVAFGLAWLLFRPSGKGAAPEEATETVLPARTYSGDQLAPFLAAVEEKDFAAMSRLGSELFRKGDFVPAYDALFAEYELDGFPPYRVFGFYTVGTREAVYRVILTMNAEDGSVESFMAETMPVVE